MMRAFVQENIGNEIKSQKCNASPSSPSLAGSRHFDSCLVPFVLCSTGSFKFVGSMSVSVRCCYVWPAMVETVDVDLDLANGRTASLCSLQLDQSRPF